MAAAACVYVAHFIMVTPFNRDFYGLFEQAPYVPFDRSIYIVSTKLNGRRRVTVIMIIIIVIIILPEMHMIPQDYKN